MSSPSRSWKEHSLEGVFLRFIVHENRQYQSMNMRDWLLHKAKELGIHGGSAFHGVAGFGRHGILHEQSFWELQGDLPVEVRFVCSESEAYKLLEIIEEESLSLFYVLSPTRYGITGIDKSEWSNAMPPMNESQ